MSTLDSTPAAPAPPGYHVDLQDPQMKGLFAGVCVGILGIILSTAFTGLRVYTKAFLARNFGIDDICIVLSWAMAMIMQVLFICE